MMISMDHRREAPVSMMEEVLVQEETEYYDDEKKFL